jgi:predicted nucleic-acid-binding Zn-ribbon protein
MEGSMKRSGVCPKCDSRKIGYLANIIHRTDTLSGGNPVIANNEAPLGIDRTELPGPLKVIKEAPAGKLEAYFCGDCGFYETYVKEPSGINSETLVGFKWVNPS